MDEGSSSLPFYKFTYDADSQIMTGKLLGRDYDQLDDYSGSFVQSVQPVPGTQNEIRFLINADEAKLLKPRLGLALICKLKLFIAVHEHTKMLFGSTELFVYDVESGKELEAHFLKPGETFNPKESIPNILPSVSKTVISAPSPSKPVIPAPPPSTAVIPPPSPSKPVIPLVGPFQVRSDVAAANLIREVKPSYPPLAKQARIQGTVRFNVVIAKDGTLKNLTVASGHPMLVQSALEAVRQWLYKPSLVDGEPTEVITTIDVNFTLNQ